MVRCVLARDASQSSRRYPFMLHQPTPEPITRMRETALYVPVKRFLEGLGFDVKGEICGCDLVALRADEPPIVVVGELKLGFNLELVLQGINRSSACDEIWLAVRASARAGRERDARVRKLCRFLGFGLLGVSATGRVEVLVEPGPWRPRRDSKRPSRLANGPRRTSEVRAAVPDAAKILLHNVYGWFFRVERGVYGLTPAGTAALSRWPAG